MVSAIGSEPLRVALQRVADLDIPDAIGLRSRLQLARRRCVIQASSFVIPPNPQRPALNYQPKHKPNLSLPIPHS